MRGREWTFVAIDGKIGGQEEGFIAVISIPVLTVS